MKEVLMISVIFFIIFLMFNPLPSHVRPWGMVLDPVMDVKDKVYNSLKGNDHIYSSDVLDQPI
jgi:hypothetical protein